ncbi:hypothetical protein [Desulfitobacterium metallireducens]|nr:hypothetical protein [Desulfitobacterium metallireducens]
MDEYSDKHFIIQAMNGNLDFFERYPYVASKSLNITNGLDLANTFLMNFSAKLFNLSHKFSKSDIDEFVRNQLAAGKDKYSEEQFFRAVSEVNVLSYLVNFTGRLRSASYEYRLTKNGPNPEARINLNDDIIIDVEVKTPGFEKSHSYPKSKLGMIKPNVVLDDNGKKKVGQYCKNASLELVMPRVLKLKDFIDSAAEKFEKPSSPKHFNLLFINWTYTDFPECELNEPISLLVNPISGILYNDAALNFVKTFDKENKIYKKLERRNLDKISAIILYRDTIDSILSGDFRYHFGHNSFKLLLNEKNNNDLDFYLLCKTLHMNPYNTGSTLQWVPADYEMKSNVPREVAENAVRFVDDVLWQSDELLSGVFPDPNLIRKLRKQIYLQEDPYYVKKV